MTTESKCVLVRGGGGFVQETPELFAPSPEKESALQPLEKPPSPPPEAWPGLVQVADLVKRPLERFLAIQASSGILLLVCAALAITAANSPWAEHYEQFWSTPLGVRAGSFVFERSLDWIVNDGLMVIFFFVVGLEIRREIAYGELSEWRRALLPLVGAFGGMVAPALLYLAFAGEPSTRAGWGVPMATDIAFAVGVLALLGNRVPPALRVLLLALAVIDDLGAICVIAFFYSSGIEAFGLLVAALGSFGILFMQRLAIRQKLAYVPLGLVAWAGIYAAGVHPTIAGVIVGLLTPVRAWLGPEGFQGRVRRELGRLDTGGVKEPEPEVLHTAMRGVDFARREAVSPAEALIERLHPWVAFGIMPIFALANAGVSLSVDSLDGLAWKVISGTAAGLFLGKPIGIFLACWLLLKLKISTLPLGLGLRHLVILGTVAGVGFTMALFVAQLAFADPMLLGAAKLGILGASLVSGVVGLLLGRLLPTAAEVPGQARSVDEAERSTDA